MFQKAIRLIHIKSTGTPNPSCLKFIPIGRKVTSNANQTLDIDRDAPQVSPLATQLFLLPGVIRVFFGKDFISVTKQDHLDWGHLRPQVESSISDYFDSNQPLFTTNIEEQPDDLVVLDGDSEAMQMVKEILASRVRPFVQEDGGDISFIEFDEQSGEVVIQMRGSCAGCPSSAATLKNGIENMLKHYVVEVTSVRNID